MAKAEIAVHIADLPEIKALVDTLAARLAAAERVVEAAKKVRDGQAEAYGWNQRLFELYAAVDAYRTHEPEPEQT